MYQVCTHKYLLCTCTYYCVPQIQYWALHYRILWSTLWCKHAGARGLPAAVCRSLQWGGWLQWSLQQEWGIYEIAEYTWFCLILSSLRCKVAFLVQKAWLWIRLQVWLGAWLGVWVWVRLRYNESESDSDTTASKLCSLLSQWYKSGKQLPKPDANVVLYSRLVQHWTLHNISHWAVVFSGLLHWATYVLAGVCILIVF